MVGFILDSTERNAREAERQMLATLVERSPDLVAVTDRTGRLVFINSAGRRLLALSQDADLGEVHLAKQFQMEERSGPFSQRVSAPVDNDYVDIETTLKSPSRDKDIQLRYASFTMADANPVEGNLRAFVAQDISERKETESKLRVSLEENRRLLEQNRILQEKLQHENISLQERNLALQSEIADIQRARFEQIIGESLAIRRTLNKVEQVSETDVTVMRAGAKLGHSAPRKRCSAAD